MCDARTIWTEGGELAIYPCNVKCKGLCNYHQKMKDGLLEPSYSDDKQNRPVRVEAGGKTLWTL